MSRKKTVGEGDQGSCPKNGRKSNPLTSWTVLLALLGAGAMPCPDCGLPLAWHLWPLALLILAVRWTAGHRRKKSKNPPSPETASESDKTQRP